MCLSVSRFPGKAIVFGLSGWFFHKKEEHFHYLWYQPVSTLTRQEASQCLLSSVHVHVWSIDSKHRVHVPWDSNFNWSVESAFFSHLKVLVSLQPFTGTVRCLLASRNNWWKWNHFSFIHCCVLRLCSWQPLLRLTRRKQRVAKVAHVFDPTVEGDGTFSPRFDRRIKLLFVETEGLWHFDSTCVYWKSWLSAHKSWF